ncbi:MAG: GNAT family N-acetyltransferase [Desulfobacterales bacterium]|nr:GNAT family N-acetyltransferase [Desulfobacterales bacterium]
MKDNDGHPDAEVGIIIRPENRPERAQIIRLYKEAGWWSPANDRQPEFVDKIAENSYCFVGAFHDGEMIGMGRVLSDGISDAYIQDVTVLRDHRRRGLGGRIIAHLLDKLRADRIEWIGLIGEPGTGNFYTKLGFKKMRGFEPFIYKG